MLWFGVSALIVVLGGAFLFLQAREVWRKASRLLSEVEQAGERVEAAMAVRTPDRTA